MCEPLAFVYCRRSRSRRCRESWLYVREFTTVLSATWVLAAENKHLTRTRYYTVCILLWLTIARVEKNCMIDGRRAKISGNYPGRVYKGKALFSVPLDGNYCCKIFLLLYENVGERSEEKTWSKWKNTWWDRSGIFNQGLTTAKAGYKCSLANRIVIGQVDIPLNVWSITYTVLPIHHEQQCTCDSINFSATIINAFVSFKF